MQQRPARERWVASRRQAGTGCYGIGAGGPGPRWSCRRCPAGCRNRQLRKEPGMGFQRLGASDRSATGPAKRLTPAVVARKVGGITPAPQAQRRTATSPRSRTRSVRLHNSAPKADAARILGERAVAVGRAAHLGHLDARQAQRGRNDRAHTHGRTTNSGYPFPGVACHAESGSRGTAITARVVVAEFPRRRV